MAESTTEQPQRIVPYLYYEDVEGALRWLSAVFGFRERAEETLRSDEGRVVHAAMELHGARIMLGSPGADYRSPQRLGQTTHNLYVYVDDLDQHFARTQRGGARLLTEITATFYGDRRYGVADLEGQHWYFAQTAQELPASEWRPSARDLAGHESTD